MRADLPLRGKDGPAGGELVVLHDSRRVLVRPLRAGDGAALADAFLRLSAASQRSRFGSAPRSLNAAALRHLVGSVDGVDHVAFAAFSETEPDRLVGIARILRYPDEPESLDVGITVADDYQGSGLGRVFAGLLATHRPRPAHRVITHIAAGNDAAISLLGAFGTARRTTDGRLVIELPASPSDEDPA